MKRVQTLVRVVAEKRQTKTLTTAAVDTIQFVGNCLFVISCCFVFSLQRETLEFGSTL